MPENTGVPPITAGLQEITGGSMQLDYSELCDPRNHRGLTELSGLPRLFAAGFAIILICQFTINIGMNLGLLPVVGIYLPLVSYGGSGLIGNFILLGIVQSIKVRK